MYFKSLGQRVAFLLFASISIKGCGYNQFYSPAATEQLSPAIQVLKGDTLIGIASRYNVEPIALAHHNRLSPPYILQKGTYLILPKRQHYLVREGEKLENIAHYTGYEFEELVHLNKLRPPYHLKPGQKLKLWDFPSGDGKEIPRVQEVDFDRKEPVKNLNNGSISKALKLTENKHLESKLQGELGFAPALLQKPKWLLGKGLKKASPARKKDSTGKGDKNQLKGARLVKANLPGAGHLKKQVLQLIWPVKGEIAAQFGAQGDNHNDGINIFAKKHTKVLSAEEGSVAYAGSDLKGYGNLVLIKHDQGYVTAYAHLERTNVIKGQFLRKGAVIGTVGTSGYVSRPQLHFEVRVNAKPRNPLKILPKP